MSPIIANNSITKTTFVYLLLRPGFRGASGTHLGSEQDQFQPGGTGKEALEVGDDAKVQALCIYVVVKLLSADTNTHVAFLNIQHQHQQ